MWLFEDILIEAVFFDYFEIVFTRLWLGIVVDHNYFFPNGVYPIVD